MHRFLSWILVGICWVLLEVPLGYAEKVKGIRSNGTLELDSGGHIRLAGIYMPKESLPLLSPLLADREVEITYESGEGKMHPSGALPVYLYVTSQEIRIPSETGQTSREEKIMVNEVLLEMGAAWVQQNEPFRYKRRFAELEARARQEGEGVWSYEAPDSMRENK